MTQEEKAKAYDIALDKIKRLLGTGSNCSREDLEHVFPELRESEDERIRKELIAHIKWCEDSGYCAKEEMTRWIAWLEKQGKTSPMLSNSQNIGKVDQKPATDFSDLRTWKYIVDAVLTEKEGIGQYLDSPFTEEAAKKLQKRFGNIEQKPAEWSEVDSKISTAIYESIDVLVLNDFGISVIEAAIWLKSLKDRVQPQSHWKPSEEMLEALYKVIPENVMAISEDEMLLEKLYQGLKYGRVLSKN